MNSPPGKSARIYVAGHRGMVGSAILRRLAQEDVQLVTVGRRGEAVKKFMRYVGTPGFAVAIMSWLPMWKLM